MNVTVCATPEFIGAAAADLVATAINSKPNLVLGVATGSSPLTLYKDLAARVKQGQLDCEEVRVFALDEYVGIGPADPASYAHFVNENVTIPLRLQPQLVHVPNGDAEDLQDACLRYEATLQAEGGVDIQIIGIGSNGHIGFNEPGSSFGSRTRVEALTPRTRRDNARFFAEPDDVPALSVTQGLATIMSARSIILVASGAKKARALAAALEGPVTVSCPGSILQFHPDVHVFVDEVAAGFLNLTEQYEAPFMESSTSR